ncbi:hypothetical protein JNN96_32670 [Mycobacterium sp. DSM 3803]|nr:hypothetical protein [Mycobacterium sp. DSM 3803]
MIRARNEGRAAEPGARNPFYGQGVLARMWMLGYKTMLLDRMNRSPARQKYLAREAVIAEFVARTGHRPAAVDRHLRD